MNGVLQLCTLTVVTSIAYFYKEWHPGFGSTFLFFVLLLLTIYELLLYFFMFRGLEINRTVEKKRLSTGQCQIIQITVKRKLPIPFIWYALEEEWPGKLPSIPSRVLVPNFRKQVTFTYTSIELPRGGYELREVRLVGGDLFGLLKRSRWFKQSEPFLVLPTHTVLGQWKVENAQKNGHVSIAQRVSDERSSVTGIREYQYGDRPSQIHWKSSAKTTTLKTKEFEYQTARHFTVLLDTNRTSYTSVEFEKGVSLAASLIYFGYRRQMSYLLGYEELGKLRVEEGSTGLDFFRLMDQLALIEREGDRSFSKVIEEILTRTQKGGHLIIISAKVDSLLVKRLIELHMKKWEVELCLVSEVKTPQEREWIDKIQRSGVRCYREMA